MITAGFGNTVRRMQGVPGSAVRFAVFGPLGASPGDRGHDDWEDPVEHMNRILPNEPAGSAGGSESSLIQGFDLVQDNE
jgi:hypothetical protein